MLASGSRLEENWSFKIRYILDSMMLDLVSIVRSQEVEPQAVLIILHFVQESTPEYRPLSRIDDALENGVLNALSKVEARLRDTPESPPPCRIHSAYVITHKDEHTCLLYEEWRIGIEIPPEVPSQKPRLEMREHSDCDLLLEEGVP